MMPFRTYKKMQKTWLINNEVLELEYDEHPKPAHEDNIAPEEIPY